MTYEDFISRFPVKVASGSGSKVLCPAHADKQPSLAVSRSKTGGVILFCHAGCSPEEVTASLGLTLRDLFVEEPKKKFKVPARAAAAPEKPKVKSVIDKIYSYTDLGGGELYQSVRLKPKSFRQRHSVKGEWVWNMDGVERVLYHLPAVVAAQTVWIVEGEKDADNLTALGLVATCNVAGAKKWLDSYNEHLKGKHVVLCGDNDEPGEEHMGMVFESLASVAKSIKRVKVPAPHKDVSDFIEATKDPRPQLDEWVSQAIPHYGGVKMPIYSMGELEVMYKRTLAAEANVRLDLSKWLPSLRTLRPLVPGDVALIAGSTGVGKTALAQNIARISGPLMTLLFEMELPGEVIFERHIAMNFKLTAREVENQYLTTDQSFGEEALTKTFPNIFICPESRLTPERFEELIRRSELKTGRPANLVLLDYAQLMEGEGDSRYERASYVAEQTKIIAKQTRTIIIVFSQIQRPGKDDKGALKGIGLFSSKDSGSWENSCGVMMGAWRDPEDETLLHLKVFKATRGGTGTEVYCNFDGARTYITERARVNPPDDI